MFGYHQSYAIHAVQGSNAKCRPPVTAVRWFPQEL